MFRFKTIHVLLALGLLAAPVSSFAGAYCIAVSGGFGHGGSTFIAPGLSFPGKNGCNPWSGFTKTASTVVLQTSGDACLSSTGLVLTVSVSNADPDFIGGGKASWDYIRLTRSSTSASFSSGTDVGSLGGSAKSTGCTSSLLTLPSSHP